MFAIAGGILLAFLALALLPVVIEIIWALRWVFLGLFCLAVLVIIMMFLK